MRRVGLATVLAVLVAGCGDAADPAPTTTAAEAPPPAATSPPPTSETDQPGEGDPTTTTRVPPEGDPAPDFTLALGEGGTFTLSEHDRPVYIVFWAEWCPQCRRELPNVDAVAPDYRDTVTIVAVAGRSTVEASRARVGEWFSPDRLLWGYDDDLWAAYAVRGQPESFLVSSDGIIVDRWFGGIGEDALRSRLDVLVAIG